MIPELLEGWTPGRKPVHFSSVDGTTEPSCGQQEMHLHTLREPSPLPALAWLSVLSSPSSPERNYLQPTKSIYQPSRSFVCDLSGRLNLKLLDLSEHVGDMNPTLSTKNVIPREVRTCVSTLYYRPGVTQPSCAKGHRFTIWKVKYRLPIGLDLSIKFILPIHLKWTEL